jgi:hypothetical protein
MSNFPYPENDVYSTNVPPTFYVQDITEWTSKEVEQLIFWNAAPSEMRSIPEWVAEQVIKCDHFDQNLRDWAWSSIDV